MAFGKFFNTITRTLILPQIKSSSPLLQNRFINPHLRLYSSDKSKDKGGKKPNNRGNKSFRHNYSEEVEAAVNHQILSELNASMVYLSMFCYYGRTDIALPGCQSYFRAMYQEEQDHALEFIQYQLMRGGQVTLFPITVPEDGNWTDITIAIGVALGLERRVKEQLEELSKLAECHNDKQLVDLVDSKFMKEQNESICELGRLLTKAKRLVDTGGVGRHLFDQEILKFVAKRHPHVQLPFDNI
ncbi:Soma ferritin-like Protein [Tribolium castaneum]|uniref:Ferritin n=1 Tax=Tribolium castaneum TaxID=7070 RepID=D2A0M8_TRICA|nr:PREDICTED: soma ferritin [Tribolium castaneum]EFA02532.1 Soma ferritin-like Protein [Tribolium castaneum]|eukprot:XP_967819.1 PREDICTED: soma ferritin [Tribolium castaneum]